MTRRTHYAREALGLEPINPGPVVREFAVRVPDLDALEEQARADIDRLADVLGAAVAAEGGQRGAPSGTDRRERVEVSA